VPLNDGLLWVFNDLLRGQEGTPDERSMQNMMPSVMSGVISPAHCHQ
jgi:hypothetical protein